MTIYFSIIPAFFRICKINKHNDEDFAAIHTQLAHVEGIGGGGLNDRFDFILMSKDLKPRSGEFTFVESSYKDFGNDGGDFNETIYQGNNKKFANALLKASDHLPVMMKIQFN